MATATAVRKARKGTNPGGWRWEQDPRNSVREAILNHAHARLKELYRAIDLPFEGIQSTNGMVDRSGKMTHLSDLIYKLSRGTRYQPANRETSAQMLHQFRKNGLAGPGGVDAINRMMDYLAANPMEVVKLKEMGKELDCKTCGKVFETRTALHAHKMVHASATCPICHEELSNANQKRKHILKEHPGELENHLSALGKRVARLRKDLAPIEKELGRDRMVGVAMEWAAQTGLKNAASFDSGVTGLRNLLDNPTYLSPSFAVVMYEQALPRLQQEVETLALKEAAEAVEAVVKKAQAEAPGPAFGSGTSNVTVEYTQFPPKEPVTKPVTKKRGIVYDSGVDEMLEIAIDVAVLLAAAGDSDGGRKMARRILGL